MCSWQKNVQPQFFRKSYSKRMEKCGLVKRMVNFNSLDWAKGNIAQINWLYDCMHLDVGCTHHTTLLRYSTHTIHTISKTTLAINPSTGRASTASVPQADIKSVPLKWVRPPSQRDKDERRKGWNKRPQSNSQVFVSIMICGRLPSF